MNNPSVDVVIITYNQENLIKETIESVINQTYDNLMKIIITDDGSTDKTPKIIEDYAENNPIIKPILAKKNKGIAHNINRALKYVSSDYVCIMGGDDLMHTQKIEKQVNYLNSKDDLVACGHDMDVFNTNTNQSMGKFSEIISFKKVNGELNIKSIFDPSLFICPSSFLYIREKLPKNGFDTRLKYLNDFLFTVELLMKGNIGYTDEILGTYRIHGNNVTSSDDAKKMAFEDALIAFSIIISKYPELMKLVKKRKEALYIDQILKSVGEGNSKRAKILSKVLIYECSYFKGIGAYLISFMLNKERVDYIYQNRTLLKFFLRFV
jgi:glycosyltransferase involved in cell wall biosynthesis